jgi:hypothetical protein
MNKYIKAKIYHMAESEILTMVSPDTIARIKATDPHPQFNVYCVGHEGEANPGIIDFGKRYSKVLKYFKDVIIRLNDKIKMGIAVFNGHVMTNEHAGREQIGEVIGKGLKTIKDRLSALVVTYIYPPYKNLSLDIASIEADMYINKKDKVVDVSDITGLALGSSLIDKPAFEGATLLATVQAFTKGDKMTLEEIKEAIQEGNVSLSDLVKAGVYSQDAVLDLEVVKDTVKKEKQVEYEHAKRVEKSLKEQRESNITLTKELEEAKGKHGKLLEQVNVITTTSLFEEIAKARNFDEKEKAFISNNLKTFKSGKEGEELKTDFNKFLDDQMVGYNKTLEILGIKKEEKKVGAPASDGKGGTTGDMTNPKDNDLIPSET